MASILNSSVTNPTIADIYRSIQNNTLILTPDFQRRFVWTRKHQEQFIDTILQGLPFPEIYVCNGEVNVGNLTTTQNVIDGQQRLTTIRLYLEDDWEDNQSIPKYSSLSDTEKRKFLSYKLVLRDLGDVNDYQVKEIFKRINSTKFKLEDIEIQNAIYDGQFIQAAKYILDKIDLKEFGVFHDSEFTRMADLHFILLIMSTIQNGMYFPGNTEVEKNIQEFNDEYPKKAQMESDIISTLQYIESLGLEKDSIWFRKSNFFTLVCELLKKGVHNLNDQELKQKLVSLEKSILSNKNNSQDKYGEYYQYMYTGTSSKKARLHRAQIFTEEVFD